MVRETCCACQSDRLTEVVDLGMHPFADSFVPADRLDEPDLMYRLLCDLCMTCGHVQLRTVTDPQARYGHFDYSYTSSNSAFSCRHWENYALSVAKKIGLTKGAAIVEIGSNDGFLAAQFQTLGYRASGIDASPSMCELAARRNVATYQGLFGQTLAEHLRTTAGEHPSLIVANNVFNHANDPRDFALGIKHLLAAKGVFVLELPYWLRTIKERRFDQIYHEHVSYITVKSACSLFTAVGMAVWDVEEVDYHGGSIRVFIGHEGEHTSHDGSHRIARQIEQETACGLFSVDAYRSFMGEIAATRYRFMENIFGLKYRGAHIVCIGAAAKANTFLNYYGLDAALIDCVTDASPSKIGKYTPGTRIPIAADEALRGNDRVYAIITSWNLADTLKQTLTTLNPNIQFLMLNEVPA